MNLGSPIDIVVQGWCGDAVAVVAVDGEVDADSCAALAPAVVQAARTYRAVIIDLTHVRFLSAAGLRCLDCVGQMPDERQGAVHLVFAESSAVRGVLQQPQLLHRWPVHPDLMNAVRQVMQPAADRPVPTGTPPRTTLADIGSRSMVRPDSRVGLPRLWPARVITGQRRPLAPVGRSRPAASPRHRRSRMLHAHAGTAPVAAGTDPTVAAVISRLMPEFREQPGPSTIERIVRQARHDLDDLHPPALPELLERLARQRLLEERSGENSREAEEH